MPRLELSTVIRSSPRDVYDLSLDVDFHQRSFVGTREQIVGGVSSGRVEEGDEVTWQAAHFGVRWRLTSRVSETDPPHRFVDTQTHGPARRWIHIHEFRPNTDGTIMLDTVDYSVPLGLPGRLAEKTVLNRHLRTLIETRNRALQREFER